MDKDAGSQRFDPNPSSAPAPTSANPLAYYGSDRADLFKLFPRGPRTVLDVGCGAGATWAARRTELGLEVWGVEFVPAAAELARSNVDRIVCADAEAVVGGTELPDAYFDSAFLADVLEHLRDPWGFLARLRRHLRPEAYLLVSIPNVRHYRVLKRLILRGRFRYTESGIMDRTHLRFFCRADVEEMLDRAGFEIVELERHRTASRLVRLVNRLTFGALDDLIAEGYHILARARPV